MRRFRSLAMPTCIAIAAACGGTEPSNAPPVAAFTARCDKLACVFESGSADADGSIAGYAWTFGDGATSTAASPTHTYAAPGGDFTVTMVVTDDDGGAATLSRKLVVSTDTVPRAGNMPPVAAFSVTCAELSCTFADQSTDPDAGDAVVSRVWNFGDGRTGDTPSAAHTFDPPGGHFTVTITVTDRHAATASTSQPVTVSGGSAPDRSGTYERATPHSPSTGASRYVIRADGTFDYIEDATSGQRTLTGRWHFATSWGGWAMEAGEAIILDFAGIEANPFCGEAYGYFLLNGNLGVALCGPLLDAGLEEGLYTNAPNPQPPDIPPPQAGEIAFVRDGKIYRANTDGTGLTQLSAGPSDASPAWSADGTRIAFTRGGATPGLYIMSADGTNLIRRASLATQDATTAPAWSPDGQWIAFACFGDGDWDLCKVKAADDGTSPVRFFPRAGYLRDAAWSPDGTRIAFISDWNMFDFWFDVWVVSPDGSQPTALRSHTPATPNPDEQYQPAWSPDGQRMALVECPTWSWFVCSSSAIAVMHADGSGLVRVAAASGFAHPTWSPDGRTIAFANADAIEWISADGSQRGRILTNGTSPAWRPGH
ncbi:MAG: PKD domain-containing protein [Bacillota bacterium]|jgi:PKD repeat protein